MPFSDWSTTAASNTSVGGVNIAEGCAPSDVNNGMRAIMAEAKAGVPAKVATTTDNAIARYNGVTGDFQNSSVTIGDTGQVVAPSNAGLAIYSFAGDLNTGITRSSTSTISILTGGSTSAVFTTNGIFQFGGHLGFPAVQNASGSANVLDDYEEGVSTPTPTAETGSFTSASSSLAYTKIGRQVTVTGEVTISNTGGGTGAGAVRITLPFTCGSRSSPGSVADVSSSGASGSAYLPGTSAIANLRKYDFATFATSSSVTLSISITYFV